MAPSSQFIFFSLKVPPIGLILPPLGFLRRNVRITVPGMLRHTIVSITLRPTIHILGAILGLLTPLVPFVRSISRVWRGNEGGIDGLAARTRPINDCIWKAREEGSTAAFGCVRGPGAASLSETLWRVGFWEIRRVASQARRLGRSNSGVQIPSSHPTCWGSLLSVTNDGTIMVSRSQLAENGSMKEE
ncbi:hypothetical protein BDZ94DRAFT_1263985 [Collybia nuda]|uniref:Uncharacterized protein n=1 Tax=Collybia nuda TaxID=64659 RepID=A0A9P5Y174_9AGAR|nr:hypothetical protein BDZ94DRAFT_1263985 [Collybia nuda]